MLYALFLLLFSGVIAQQEEQVHQLWEQEKDALDYQKPRNFKGPEDWYASSPADMDDINLEEVALPEAPSNSNGSIEFTPEEMQREREKRYGKEYGDGNGNKKENPELIKPEPLELPDVDLPEIDTPDIDLPDIDAPNFLSSESFWRMILILILGGVLLWLAYYLFKNYSPKGKKISVQNVENDWNPEEVSVSELDRLLQEAKKDGNYRQCVRVYYLFILKELTDKKWIEWRAQKTNYDYVLEMKQRKHSPKFERTVRIYDLVWYGNYAIEKKEYDSIEPILVNYYKELSKNG